MSGNWFERLTGFTEADYATTRERLRLEDGHLVSHTSGERHAVGRFEAPTLAALRARTGHLDRGVRTRVNALVGDARTLHREPRFAGALFQVASQFNALEMVSPDATPEHGVTRYVDDPTQGPACAVAAGAATIWRNYALPLGGQTGQTATRQLDTLAPLGSALAAALGRPAESLWTMRNGYALAHEDGLRAIGTLLREAGEPARDALRGQLAIAAHHDVDVTDAPPGARPRVSQVFCAALPVAYTAVAPALWAPFAQLVLEAAYEATLRLAAERAAAGASPTVLLTRLGGGVFGNDDAWIDAAIERALAIAAHAGLDVQLVSHQQHHPSFRAMAARWAG